MAAKPDEDSESEATATSAVMTRKSNVNNFGSVIPVLRSTYDFSRDGTYDYRPASKHSRVGLIDDWFMSTVIDMILVMCLTCSAD